MKKYACFWFLATITDYVVVSIQTFYLNSKIEVVDTVDFNLKDFSNVFYWIDSIWFIFCIIAIHAIFAYLGLMSFRMLKKYFKKTPNIALFILLYLSYGGLIFLSYLRFNLIYASILYLPFTLFLEFCSQSSAIAYVFFSLIASSTILLTPFILGYIYINIKHYKKFIAIYLSLFLISYYPYIFGILNNQKSKRPQPDIVFILLDAVRPDYLKIGGAPFDAMPKLTQLIKSEGVFFSDATTTVARSFPSAVSMLTGKNAINSGARDNISPKKLINFKETLPSTLQKHGYHTVLSNDAYQFYNFDKDYGFDDIWASGLSLLKLFAMSTGGNMPLPLLFSNTRLGELFFPYTYSDRNIDSIYNPQSYVNKIDRNLNLISKEKPLFLFMSLEYTHPPFAEETLFSKEIMQNLPEDYKDVCRYYISSMNSSDTQLFQIIDVLEKHGRLDNTLLIIGSDHGIGFNMTKDTIIMAKSKEISDSFPEIYYGNNAVNKSSNQISLAVFNKGLKYQFKKGIRKDQVSSIDIAPTILDILNIKPQYKFDGKSFKEHLLFESSKPNLEYRFLETGYSTANLDKTDPSFAAKGGRKVVIDFNKSIFEWNEPFFRESLKYKQRSVLYGDWALVAVTNFQHPIIVNRELNLAWEIQDTPNNVPVDSMIDKWCQYNKNDLKNMIDTEITYDSILNGLCTNLEKRKNLLNIIKLNDKYDPSELYSFKRSKKLSSSNVCSRISLY